MPRRILVVTSIYPWYGNSGSSQRIGTVIETLSRLGEVDLCILDVGGEPPPMPVEWEQRISRTVVIPTRAKPSLRGRADKVAGGRLPVALPRKNPAVERALRAWLPRQPYSLVWFNREHTWLQTHSVVDAPSIVDIDDLNDFVLRRWLTAEGTRPPALTRWWARRQVKGWRELHDAVASRADVVVVCSEADRERLGHPNARVIPNTYPRPSSTATSETGHRILFQGLLSYGPNAAAAAWAATELLPRIRRRIPDARLALVGKHGPALKRLGEHDGVELTGWVQDITPHVLSSDLVVAPIRWGSGTRIKIIEAFAHGVPVVSTRIGADGLEVENGRHLSIVDDDDGFAEACCAVLQDPELRARFRKAGRELYLARYTKEHAVSRIRDVALEVGR